MSNLWISAFVNFAGFHCADFFTLTAGPVKFTVRVCGNSRIFVKLPSFVFRTANFPPKFDLRIFKGPDTI